MVCRRRRRMCNPRLTPHIGLEQRPVLPAQSAQSSTIVRAATVWDHQHNDSQWLSRLFPMSSRILYVVRALDNPIFDFHIAFLNSFHSACSDQRS